jgi:hypothetical protein
MWRIFTSSFAAGTVSGHRMIDVIPGDGQRQGQENESVPGRSAWHGGITSLM